MVQKFFLALDYRTSNEARQKGDAALQTLRRRFGNDFVEQQVGIKINQDLLTCSVDKGLMTLSTNVFADMKIAHGPGTGKGILDILHREAPTIKYVTVAATLGTTILKEYSAHAKPLGLDLIAFTAHTNIPEPEVFKIHGKRSLDKIIYTLADGAMQAGFHAVVLEGKRLENEDIQNLPIKKLVTGIRIDQADKGTQSRVTALDQLATVKKHVDYVVVSSRYLDKPQQLADYIAVLRSD